MTKAEELAKKAEAAGIQAGTYTAAEDPLDDIAKAAINNHVGDVALTFRGRSYFSSKAEKTELCETFRTAFVEDFAPVFAAIRAAHPEVTHAFLAVHYNAVHIAYNIPSVVDGVLFGAMVYDPERTSRENVYNILAVLGDDADEGKLITKLDEHGLIPREDYVPMMQKIKYG